MQSTAAGLLQLEGNVTGTGMTKISGAGGSHDRQVDAYG